MLGAVGVVAGAISRCELVVGGPSGGGVRTPIVLRFIRDGRSTSMEVILNMNARDLRVRLGDRREGKYRRDYRK